MAPARSRGANKKIHDSIFRSNFDLFTVPAIWEIEISRNFRFIWPTLVNRDMDKNNNFENSIWQLARFRDFILGAKSEINFRNGAHKKFRGSTNRSSFGLFSILSIYEW